MRAGAGDRRRDAEPQPRSASSRQGCFWNWYLFHDPFTFVAFWIYFTCATASCKRAPFDLAEAESELVAGFHTEYSGFRWSFFFMAEYGSMFAVSGIADAAVPRRLAHRVPAVRAEPTTFGPWLGNVINVVVFIVQGLAAGLRDDVGALDAAAAAHRPGDDDVPEVPAADLAASCCWA